MNSSTCPVCGNKGIPAYHNEDVVCPCCGSDLSVYRTLSEIQESSIGSSKTARKYKILALVLPVILLLGLSFSLYHSVCQQSQMHASILVAETAVAQLKDSVATLNGVIESMQSPAQTPSAESGFTSYQIVRNDSPWRIVYKFYGIRGDWKELAQKIAVDNNIWDEAESEWKPIYPGQVIKIYNN